MHQRQAAGEVAHQHALAGLRGYTSSARQAGNRARRKGITETPAVGVMSPRQVEDGDRARIVTGTAGHRKLDGTATQPLQTGKAASVRSRRSILLCKATPVQGHQCQRCCLRVKEELLPARPPAAGTPGPRTPGRPCLPPPRAVRSPPSTTGPERLTHPPRAAVCTAPAPAPAGAVRHRGRPDEPPITEVPTVILPTTAAADPRS